MNDDVYEDDDTVYVMAGPKRAIGTVLHEINYCPPCELDRIRVNKKTHEIVYENETENTVEVVIKAR